MNPEALNGSAQTAAEQTSKPVQMRLQPRTLDRLDNLMTLTGATNKTQIISSSIQLTEEIVSNLKKGAKIIIEQKDGSKEQLKIIGL